MSGTSVGGLFRGLNASSSPDTANAVLAQADLLRWDDLRFPFTQTKLGALGKPDFDETHVGLLFPQNDATEIVRFIAQMPHSHKLGSALSAHVHWQQSANTPVTWALEYKIISQGGAVPADFTKTTSANTVFSYVNGNLAQITAFPSIAMPESLSVMILCKLYREDNTTVGDVLAYEADFHFLSDTVGSLTEFSK